VRLEAADQADENVLALAGQDSEDDLPF